MKIKTFALPMAALLLSLSACSSSTAKVLGGEYKIVEYKYTTIDAIDASSGIEVRYTQSATPAIKASVPEEAIPYLRVEVKNGTLYCGIKNVLGGLRIPKIVVNVSAPSISEFDVSSGAKINITSPINLPGQDIEFDASSSGSIYAAKAVAKEISIEASSSGVIKIDSAEATQADAKANSSGTISATITGLDEIEASASSSGAIYLGGNAAKAEYKASSSGMISADGMTVDRGEAQASSSGSIRCNIDNARIHTSSSGTVSNKK